MEFLNVKANQAAFLEKLLKTSSENISEHWKVLIYDSLAQKLISPLLSVQKLRKLGVTLHLSINARRDAVPEVPVVYLIHPNIENVKRIGSDCERNLYDEIHIHFIEPAPEDVLEFLAKSMVENGTVSKVKRVFDQFMNFISLDKDLFSLEKRGSFTKYNLPSLQESAVINFMEDVAKGIINVLTTVKVLPIIRCPKGGPAELLAKVLTKKLRLLHKESSYQEAFFMKDFSTPNSIKLEEIALSSKRPLILIADRGVDMASMMFHSSGYQTLVDDLLKIESNRVKITTDSKPTVYSLETDRDEFWMTYAGRIIPEAVENHSSELQSVSSQVLKIKQQSGNEEQASNLLLKTVESLPKLLEKKKLLEMHLEIIRTTMNLVSEREIYNFAEVEEKMMSRQYGEVKAVKKLLENDKLKFTDKARLVAIFLLKANGKKEENDSLFEILEKIKEDTENFTFKEDEAYKSVEYIRKLQSLTSGFSTGSLNGAKDTTSLWKFADKAAQGLLDAQKKVKGMVYSESLFPIIQMLDIVTKPLNLDEENKENEALLYFDPKIGETETPKFQRQHNEINAGIVFVLGGGSYAEYQNLKQYCLSGDKASVLQSMASTKKPSKRFIYGSTEMLNATEFMAQVSSCLN